MRSCGLSGSDGQPGCVRARKQAWDDPALRITSIDVKDPRQCRRHIQTADHGFLVHAFVKPGTPEDACYTMRVVKPLRMVEIAMRIDFIVPAKIRPNHDRRVAAKVRMAFHPAENPAYGRVCCFHGL